MQKFVLSAALAASLIGLAATPGMARGVDGGPLALTVSPGVNPGPAPFRPVAGRRVAEQAANSVGLADVDDIDLDDSVWTVTGTDVQDKDMTVTVDARSGRILQASYD
jgi:hypothetical protein